MAKVATEPRALVPRRARGNDGRAAAQYCPRGIVRIDWRAVGNVLVTVHDRIMAHWDGRRIEGRALNLPRSFHLGSEPARKTARRRAPAGPCPRLRPLGHTLLRARGWAL